MVSEQFTAQLKKLQEELRNQMRETLTDSKERTHEISHFSQIYEAIDHFLICPACFPELEL